MGSLLLAIDAGTKSGKGVSDFSGVPQTIVASCGDAFLAVVAAGVGTFSDGH